MSSHGRRNDDEDGTENYLHKKNSKPLMEKRRRARINASLSELRDLLHDQINCGGKSSNKLEKADVLDITVRYVKNTQKEQFRAGAVGQPNVFDSYSIGYTQCASDMTSFLSQAEGVDPELRNRLLAHLLGRANVQPRPEAAVPSPPAHNSSPFLFLPPAPSSLPRRSPDTGPSSVESFSGTEGENVLDLSIRSRSEGGPLWRPW